VSGAAEGSLVNKSIAAKREAAHSSAPASASVAPSGQSDTHTPKLSAADKELARLADEGDPFACFVEEGAIEATAALFDLRSAYRGKHFAPPSAQLLRLIQAGKLTAVSLAVPVTVADAAAARSKERNGTTLRVLDGAFTTAPLLDTTNLSGYEQFVSALVCTILPALFTRPRAMLEWLGLAKSVCNINAQLG